jgi:ABC-type nitrate/sulfonate/bicarbonate transport system substrate-binding protein
VNVSLILFKTADASTEALLSGQVDVIYVGSSSVAFAVEEQTPGQFKIFQIQQLSPSNPGTDLLVKKGSLITDPLQLAGKKVAIFPSSTAKVLSQLVFEKVLGPGRFVDLIQVSPLNWADSLATNTVDGVLAYEPFGSFMVADGVGKIIVTEPFGQYVMHNIPLAIASFSTSFVKNKPAAAGEVAYSLAESVDYMKKNPIAAKRTFLNYSKVITEKTLSITPVLTNWAPITDENAKSFQQLADLLVEKGVYSKRINVTDMLYRPPKTW